MLSWPDLISPGVQPEALPWWLQYLRQHYTCTKLYQILTNLSQIHWSKADWGDVTREAGPGWTWFDVKWRRCSLILYHLSTKYMDDLVNLCTLDLWHIGKKIMHHCRQGDERPKTLCVLHQQPTEPGCCFKWGKILIHVKCDHLTFSCCARGWIF